jgi:hypothetical protein
MTTKIKPLGGHAWLITKVNEEVLSPSDVGQWNWVDYDNAVDVESSDEVDWTFAERFKLLDDDGIVYCHGKYLGPDDENMFSPLDDWGRGGLGCTTIQYRNKTTGKFDTL